MMSPSSPISTGLVKPNRRMLSAICWTCFLEAALSSDPRGKANAGDSARSKNSLSIHIGALRSNPISPRESTDSDGAALPRSIRCRRQIADERLARPRLGSSGQKRSIKCSRE
jgi:hypothetical protein